MPTRYKAARLFFCSRWKRRTSQIKSGIEAKLIPKAGNKQSAPYAKPQRSDRLTQAVSCFFAAALSGAAAGPAADDASAAGTAPVGAAAGLASAALVVAVPAAPIAAPCAARGRTPSSTPSCHSLMASRQNDVTAIAILIKYRTMYAVNDGRNAYRSPVSCQSPGRSSRVTPCSIGTCASRAKNVPVFFII